MSGDSPMLQSSIRSLSLGYLPQISSLAWCDLVTCEEHRWLLGSVPLAFSPALLRVATVMSWWGHLPQKEM